ncbi:MAG: transcriptional repressor LexA [Rhodobacteraceae bacterium]|nr:transcriptional repressor LexA [Paracoccaceae bacterium]
MLTKRQLALLEIIDQKIQEYGYSPSYEEMKEEMNLKSKSGVHRLIQALEERGFLRRLENRARALEVLKRPDKMGGSETSTATRMHTEPRWPVAEAVGDFIVPLMGRIAAGSPVEAISTREADIGVPPHLITGIGEHFALTVSGDSMIDAGILDQDTAIIRKQQTAENGEIIVALIRGEEATLKRLRCRGSSVALEAANPEFETRMYRADEVAVQGKLVGLLRSY